MRSLPLLLLLFTSILSAETPQTSTSKYPVHWTSEVKLKDQNEIDRAIKAPVDMSKSGGSLDCGHDPETMEATTCRTCADYFQWKADPSNPLKFLKQAKPSSKSYFENFVLKNSSVADLNPLIERVTMAEETIYEITESEEYSVTLKSEDGYEEVSIDQIAWGDFNQDGTEDSLFYLFYHATQGTMRYFILAIATRESRDGTLKVLEQWS